MNHRIRDTFQALYAVFCFGASIWSGFKAIDFIETIIRNPSDSIVHTVFCTVFIAVACLLVYIWRFLFGDK